MKLSISSQKICQSILWMFAIFMMYLIINTASFAFGDQFTYMNSIGAGNHYMQWIGNGRFSPLGNIHFNLLLLLPFGNAIISMWFLECWVFGLFIYILWKILRTETAIQKYISTIVILSLPFIFNLLFVYTAIQYMESLIFLILALFMFFYQKAKATDSGKYYLISFLFAAILTYMREPMFGVFLIVSAVDFLFGKKTKNSKLFNLSLILNAAVYLCLWYIFSVVGAIEFYKGYNPLSFIGILKNIYETIPIIYFIFAFGLYRACKVIISKDRKYIIEDQFLFAGIGYSVAMITMGMCWDYYYMPSVITALPRLVIWIQDNIKAGGKYLITLIFSLTSYLHIQSKSYISANETVKNIMKNQTGSVNFIAGVLHAKEIFQKPVYWYKYTNPNPDDIFNLLAYDMFKSYYYYVGGDKVEIKNDTDKIDENAIYLVGFNKDHKENLTDLKSEFKRFIKGGYYYVWGQDIIEWYYKK